MKPISTGSRVFKSGLRKKQQGSARVVVLVLICAAIAGAAVWHYQTKKSAETAPQKPEKPVVDLSDSSKAVLGRLRSTVEIHFYSLLDPASVPESDREFAKRVDELLAAYERNGNGKVLVTRHNSRSDADANVAVADGIQAFNRDKGDVCYFGIRVTNNSQKESFPRLSSEWEQALESDLSRAIARVTAVTPPTQSVVSAPPNGTSSAEELKAAIPNLDSLSLEEGTRKLRETALQEFRKTADEMTVRVKEAQQHLTAAQDGKSEAEQQAAMKELQQVQSEHTEKLKAIAAKLQSQIAALEQIKKTSGEPAAK